MRLYLGVAVLILVGFFVSAVTAKEGIVRTKAGLTYQGDVVDEGGDVSVNVKGIKTTIPRDEIVGEIIYFEDVDQQFADRLAKLDANDTASHIKLARWAFDAQRYDLSRLALEQVLEVEPNNAEAIELLQLLSMQKRLDSKSQVGEDARSPQPPRVAPPEGEGPRASGKLLTADEINWIRQAELTDKDTNARVRFEKDVRRTYADRVGEKQVDFERRSNIEQVRLILNERDEEMRKLVRVLSDPLPIQEFRRTIQPIILSGCATSSCHGSAGGGGLMLHNPGDSEAATYTNFYILQKYPTVLGPSAAGVAASVLIDRTRPTDSLILEYGLAREEANFKHPQVAGFRPVYRSRKDKRFELVEKWITQSLSPLEPAYGFDLPTRIESPDEATTQPATQPTTQPDAG